MEPVPHLTSHPAAPYLAWADRPQRPTSSIQPDRSRQRPYYHFYYGRPKIVADNLWSPFSLRVGDHAREAFDLVGAFVDLRDLFMGFGVATG